MRAASVRRDRGAMVGPAEVDDADAAAMEAMFEAVLPDSPAGEARRRLTEHGWDLQAALADAAREEPARALFDGAPLGHGAAGQVAHERGGEEGCGGVNEGESKERGRSVGEEREEETKAERGDAAELVELRLLVQKGGAVTEEIVRVRPDVVDLTAHTGLMALPEELRASAVRVRVLKVASERLQVLPAWLGELTGLTELQ